MKMMVKKLEKATVHVAHGEGRTILHMFQKQLTNSNSESDRELNTTDSLRRYLIKEKFDTLFHVLCLYTTLKVTSFTSLKVMTIED